MATIYRISQAITDSIGFGEMQPLINNYWGNALQERSFPIPYWKLNQLFIASTADEVAFRVKDINNPTLVNGEWISYEDSMDEILQDPDVQPGIVYFIMTESVFNDIQNGIPFTVPIQRVVITGRIGKIDPAGFDYMAFLALADCKLINPGGTGDGAASGIRIPPVV